MITMTALPGSKFTGATGLSYIADAQGFVRFVRTSDVDVLRAAGAVPAVIAATKHLKVQPHQNLHFAGASHRADARGILLDVPHDDAAVLIRNRVATEATEADLTPLEIAHEGTTEAPSEQEPEQDVAELADDNRPAEHPGESTEEQPAL